ncbi:MAG: ABC transporter ATP-binding protein [Eubacteriales bacterium]|nr:ABC transporter ATP-binding protein [Eubacteriales bacterium]
MKDIILKAEDLYFSYDDEKSYSLNGFSIEIERGKKVAFMGANGSGKSTFFLCCNGIHRPVKGTLYIDNKPVEYSKKRLLDLRSKVGIVFQDPDNQLFSASVRQEISFGALNKGMSEEETHQAVEKVIETLEIGHFAERPTHSLSGGQKKQVSIADVLVMNPEIIILDEPAASLDPKHTTIVNKIVDILVERGITVLMSTHNVDYALEWADDIALVHRGKILMYGSPLEVFSNEEALKKTNLEKPAALELFHRLCEKGVLNDSLPLPRNLKTLEEYLNEL